MFWPHLALAGLTASAALLFASAAPTTTTSPSRSAPQAHIETELPTSAANVTNCQFTDTNGNQVCVTTANGPVNTQVFIGPCGSTGSAHVVPKDTRRKVTSDCFEGVKWTFEPIPGKTWGTVTDCSHLSLYATEGC
jgi:hypothetical protein